LRNFIVDGCIIALNAVTELVGYLPSLKSVMVSVRTQECHIASADYKPVWSDRYSWFILWNERLIPGSE
jgi:hypothetical protein